MEVFSFLVFGIYSVVIFMLGQYTATKTPEEIKKQVRKIGRKKKAKVFQPRTNREIREEEKNNSTSNKILTRLLDEYKSKGK